MKIKTNELTGIALDWAVAKCEEDAAYSIELREKGHAGRRPFMRDVSPSSAGGGWWPQHSTDWAQGGPIIERERIVLGYLNGLSCATTFEDDKHQCMEFGPTPLIAAMRCYVASKLGAEVDVPNELTN